MEELDDLELGIKAGHQSFDDWKRRIHQIRDEIESIRCCTIEIPTTPADSSVNLRKLNPEVDISECDSVTDFKNMMIPESNPQLDFPVTPDPEVFGHQKVFEDTSVCSILDEKAEDIDNYAENEAKHLPNESNNVIEITKEDLEEKENHEDLTVLTPPNPEISIPNLSQHPRLQVLPVITDTDDPLVLSSFEALYDETLLEQQPGEIILPPEKLRQNIGARFQGTFDSKHAESGSSFEDIYTLPKNEKMQENLISCDLPDNRWSAPVEQILKIDLTDNKSKKGWSLG